VQDDEPVGLDGVEVAFDDERVGTQATLAPSPRTPMRGCRPTLTQTATWTGPYVKYCSTELDELDEWAVSHSATRSSAGPYAIQRRQDRDEAASRERRGVRVHLANQI